MTPADIIRRFLAGEGLIEVAIAASMTREEVEEAIRGELHALRRGYNTAHAIMRACAKGFERLHAERREAATGSAYVRASRLGAAEAFWRACQALGHGMNILAAASMQAPEKEGSDAG